MKSLVDGWSRRRMKSGIRGRKEAMAKTSPTINSHFFDRWLEREFFGENCCENENNSDRNSWAFDRRKGMFFNGKRTSNRNIDLSDPHRVSYSSVMQLNGSNETIGKSPSLDKPLRVEEHSQTGRKLFRRNQGFDEIKRSSWTRNDLSDRVDLPEVQPSMYRSLLRHWLEERLSSRYPSLCSDQKQEPLSTWATFAQSDHETNIPPSPLETRAEVEEDDDPKVNQSAKAEVTRSTSWSDPSASVYLRVRVD